jgi:hypothetical protein
MEVHHHSHTSRKKCLPAGQAGTHYFWEFLMLFLAVFCGFLAEYQLEHKIEKDRAADFAKTLYVEIKRDTASLHEIRYRTHRAFISLDSLVNILSESGYESRTGELYYHCGLGMYNFFFTANEATLQQMKSSGAIRYFKNKDLITSITEYEYLIRVTYQLETNLYLNYLETRKVQLKLFDTRHIYSSKAWENNYTGMLNFLGDIKNKSIPLLSKNPELVAEFRNWAQNRSELAKLKINQYDKFLVSADKLLTTLNKEYNLD